MENRALKFGEFNNSGDTVVYVVTREYRAKNNWGLISAIDIALQYNKKLIVLGLFDETGDLLNEVQKPFLRTGIENLERELAKLNINLIKIKDLSLKEINSKIEPGKVFSFVTDFSPLKKVVRFINDVSKKHSLLVVDSHNIVPCFLASDKEEYAAYTIRSKIQKRLSEFLVDFPELKKMKSDNFDPDLFSSSNISQDKKNDSPKKVFKDFINHKLEYYGENRNDPNLNITSNLSPYLHFGFISSQEIYLELNKINANYESIESFIEEIVIRKELSDNYCFYNQNYDNISGVQPWALKTLNDHRNDIREFVYTEKEFETAETHDKLWNAAQVQLLTEGKIHGYMRMYWAKKILEWTESPEQAFEIAITLNDKFALDGIDPNGYTGIAWSIGGVHDRAWKEREIFGKIRFMNFNGCKRKFDIEKYINMHKG